MNNEANLIPSRAQLNIRSCNNTHKSQTIHKHIAFSKMLKLMYLQPASEVDKKKIKKKNVYTINFLLEVFVIACSN